MKPFLLIVSAAIIFVAMLVVLSVIIGLFVGEDRLLYAPPIAEYPYSIGYGRGGAVVFCKVLDAEKRVAYVCTQGLFTKFIVGEYHMTPLDNWVKR